MVEDFFHLTKVIQDLKQVELRSAFQFVALVL